MKRLFRFFVCIFWMTYSVDGLSLIDGQFVFGRRFIRSHDKTKELDISGWESLAALHVDPWPLVPVSFGGSYSNTSISSGFSYELLESYLHEFDIEASAWVPLILFTPYLKLRIPVWSKFYIAPKDDTNHKIIDTTVSGFHVHLGIAFNIIPYASFLIEVGRSIEEINNFYEKDREFNAYFIGAGLQVAF